MKTPFAAKATITLLVVFTLVVASRFSETPTIAQEKSKVETDKAVERTRKMVRMLDDLYKTTVVLVTQTYVEDESSTPAIAAAMALWDAMDKKGWHKARLVDATGDPYDDENVAKSDFEKKMIKKLTSDNNYFDTVVVEGDKRYLEAVTQVPVVMKKCTLCHDNYKNAKPGETIGAVSYRILIDE